MNRYKVFLKNGTSLFIEATYAGVDAPSGSVIFWIQTAPKSSEIVGAFPTSEIFGFYKADHVKEFKEPV